MVASYRVNYSLRLWIFVLIAGPLIGCYDSNWKMATGTLGRGYVMSPKGVLPNGDTQWQHERSTVEYVDHQGNKRTGIVDRLSDAEFKELQESSRRVKIRYHVETGEIQIIEFFPRSD